MTIIACAMFCTGLAGFTMLAVEELRGKNAGLARSALVVLALPVLAAIVLAWFARGTRLADLDTVADAFANDGRIP